MLIRKTQQPAEFPANSIHGAYTESDSDTYTCNFINNAMSFSSGSNEKGSWLKYPDGTMICYWQSGVPGGGTGGFNVKANAVTSVTLQFPETFSSEPVVMPILMSGSSAATVGYISVSPWLVTTTQFQFRFYNKDSAAREPNYGYMAIGRWK